MNNKIIKNIFANLGGNLAAAILMAIALPFYLQEMKPESFGLITFFLSLQIILRVLDLGLGATVNREVAGNLVYSDKLEKLKNTIGSIEVVYYIMGSAIACAFLIGANNIAQNWLKVESAEEIKYGIIVLGISIGARWPTSMYMGVLRGAEKHVLMNLLTSTFNFIKTIGVIPLLIHYDNTIAFYGKWQLFFTVIELFVFKYYAWKAIKKERGEKLHPSLAYLKGVMKFTAGVALTSIAAVIIKQIDKLILSKILPLSKLGDYYVAVFLATGIALIVSSIVSAYYPIMSRLYALNKKNELRETFSTATKLTAYVTSPIAVAIFFYAHDILFLWTGNRNIAESVELVLQILAISMLINVMMMPMQNLLFCAGRSWYSAINNILSLIFYTPVVMYLVFQYGTIGAATGWLLYNTIYFLIFPNLTMDSVIYKYRVKWYVNDIMPYVITAFGVFAIVNLGWDVISQTDSVISSIVKSIISISLYLVLSSFLKMTPNVIIIKRI